MTVYTMTDDELKEMRLRRERIRTAQNALANSDSPTVREAALRTLKKLGGQEQHGMSVGGSAAEARARRSRQDRYRPNSSAAGVASPSANRR